MRTPLSGIMECLSHYAEKEGLSEEDRDVISIGRLCSEQLLTVINDVLDFSKVKFLEDLGLELCQCGFFAFTKEYYKILRFEATAV